MSDGGMAQGLARLLVVLVCLGCMTVFFAGVLWLMEFFQKSRKASRGKWVWVMVIGLLFVAFGILGLWSLES